jgi:MFS superfamily sulfate permease-like transporter
LTDRAGEASVRPWRRLVPIATWLPRYDRRLLGGDIAAGVAVTAMIVPKDLGYAGIAGVPIQNGLYAAAAGAIIYALFCTSRQISTGPSSSLAAVAGGTVLVTGLGGDEAANSSPGSPSSQEPSSCCSPFCGWAGSPSSSPRRW